jgi:hypothetical protein
MKSNVIGCFFALIVANGSAFAASGGSVTMLDASSQPLYQVSINSPVDDGAGCDSVAVVMYDQTGTATDTDVLCVPLSGTGSDFTSWGSIESGYTPTRAPITYVLYDLTPAAAACFSDENSNACLVYTRSLNPLSETFYNAPGLSVFSPPFSLLSGRVSVPTLSEWGLILLASSMALITLISSRKRKA